MKRPQRFATRYFIASLALLLLVGPLDGSAARFVSAATCSSWGNVQPPNPGGPSNLNTLSGVAALSPCDVWAVGAYNNGTTNQTLIVRWNGTVWTQVVSPNPGGPTSSNVLTSVVALSATNIWAVGCFNNGTLDQTLVLHWNGSTWAKVSSPSPGVVSGSYLTGISALSAKNIWAVGHFSSGTANRTLVLHWNGKSWKRIASPNVGGSENRLRDLTMVSARNIWAVGYYDNGTALQTLVLHWNGKTWKHILSWNVGYNLQNELHAVTATSATSVWAVGYYVSGAHSHTLVLHWNGKTWKRVATPNPSSTDNELWGATALSAKNVWAVGQYFNSTAFRYETLVTHWNGRVWKQIASLNVGASDNTLVRVTALSSTKIAAVGGYYNGTVYQALALQCC